MTLCEGIMCCSCKSSSPKYKCPTCRAPYCSVNCCQQHKSLGCVPPSSETDNNENVTQGITLHPTEDTLPPEKLRSLSQSSQVRECLNNPHLRHIINVIDKSQNPTDMIAQAMLEPIFMEFATECLKVVHPQCDV